MSRKRDLTKYVGDKYNKLTVIKFDSFTKTGHRKYLCKCDCGNEKILRVDSVRYGNTRSCGDCYKTEGLKYIGLKYNMLTILKFEKRTRSGHYEYLCKCDCGNEKVIRLDCIISGNSKSCGCIKRKDELFIGRKYGMLTILKYDSISTNQHSKYLCKCDCGNEVNVIKSNIITGNTRSCGCLKRNRFNINSDIIL